MSFSPSHRAHGRPCAKCGMPCYSQSGTCRQCSVAPNTHRFPLPQVAPEDYLMACAEELLKRHRQRAEALRALGILEAA